MPQQHYDDKDLQARNIKATGKIDADGNISAGNWVWAKNGYGDAIGFGGDAMVEIMKYV
jgi:hypothetical protein